VDRRADRPHRRSRPHPGAREPARRDRGDGVAAALRPRRLLFVSGGVRTAGVRHPGGHPPVPRDAAGRLRRRHEPADAGPRSARSAPRGESDARAARRPARGVGAAFSVQRAALHCGAYPHTVERPRAVDAARSERPAAYGRRWRGREHRPSSLGGRVGDSLRQPATAPLR
jgi:hypothetical protein